MNPFYKNLALWCVITVMMIMLYKVFSTQNMVETAPSYSDFLAMVDKNQVEEVTIQGQELTFTDNAKKKFTIYTPNDTDLIKTLRDKGVRIKAKPPADAPWYNVLISWFPMLILIGVWIFFMRQMQSGGGKAMSFGKSRARLLSDTQEKVTFKDVAGIDEAKEELSEIVEFLRDPKRFTRLGGRIPKGVLLMGPPGTGKTLLGRAIAGEAGVPFFSISGSDFVEMFVGVGASRVRDLFLQGKKHAPCIIFIDEIDAVGRHRGAGLGGGHDEREQTLNQLLVEMDGFDASQGVVIMGATNRPEVLDPALLRSGRFDRQVLVDRLPDIRGREKILKVHMKKTPIGGDVSPLVLAKGTPGFSGADLENLVNEAALLAAKRGKEKLEMVDFEDSKDKVYMGLERKSKVIKEEDRKTTAYHEGGHALVARFLPNADAINKITIIPRGRAAGVTWFLPEERDFKYKDQLEGELAVAFGGRVAEEIVFNRISTGASNDIKQATELAQQMVRSWGMSDELGPLSYSKGEEQVFLGREIAQHRDYSELTAQKIDDEISRLIKSAHEKAKAVLEEHLDLLHALSDLLLEKETVLGKELDELIISLKPDIDLPNRVHDEEIMAETKADEAPDDSPDDTMDDDSADQDIDEDEDDDAEVPGRSTQ